MRAAIPGGITVNEGIKESFKAMLKKAIDDHSCKEPLEVGFRRGVEWYVFESGFTGPLLERIAALEIENKQLKEALHRQATP